MAQRSLLAPHPVIEDGSMSTSITSDISIVQQLALISYTYSWVGTSPVGEIVVEVSNDYSNNPAGNVLNPGTWNALPLDSATAVSGNTGVGAIDIQLPGFYAIRTRYIRASGTGTIQAIVVGKVS